MSIPEALIDAMRAKARDPHTETAMLWMLATVYPEDVLCNPILDLLALEDPHCGLRAFATAYVGILALQSRGIDSDGIASHEIYHSEAIGYDIPIRFGMSSSGNGSGIGRVAIIIGPTAQPHAQRGQPREPSPMEGDRVSLWGTSRWISP